MSYVAKKYARANFARARAAKMSLKIIYILYGIDAKPIF